MHSRLKYRSVALLLVSACSAGSDSGGEASVVVADSPSSQDVEAGVLTAGAWDDNRNYAYFSGYVDELASLDGAPAIAQVDRDAAQAEFAGDRAPVSSLDVVFVVDNTGSMGDEIEYLKSEFAAISEAVADRFPDVDVRWATIAYQDEGDAYLVRTVDFSADPDSASDGLEAMAADGGGDYPEGVAEALAATVELDWSSQGRLVFWIADAPHHVGDEADVAESLLAARDLGLHFYPVAASGADELTELTMRSAAQLTGGRYLFLTDDSGIGDSHKEPTIPCYFVTKLDRAVIRMMAIEQSGVYVEPAADEIIRTGGDPTDGGCELDDGTTLVVF